MYKLAIIDDDINDLNKLKQFIPTDDFFIDCFQDCTAIDLDEEFDVLFVDIDMPDINGVDFSNRYKEKHQHVLIIFVTNHSELVFDTFKVHPFDFIRKEYLNIEISRVIEEILIYLKKENKTITIKSNGFIEQIKIKDILFCESNKHNCFIYKTDNTVIKTRMKLSELKMLLDSSFYQVNKSYLIHWDFVKQIANGFVIYENGLSFSISRPIIKDVKDIFLMKKAEKR